jgi:hypothetical protein
MSKESGLAMAMYSCRWFRECTAQMHIEDGNVASNKGKVATRLLDGIHLLPSS